MTFVHPVPDHCVRHLLPFLQRWRERCTLVVAGGAYDVNDEVVWQDDDEIEDAAGVANWVGGSRAEGGSEALESADSRKSANASKKRR